MLTFEELSARSKAHKSNPICLFDRERHNLRFLPDCKGESPSDRLSEYIRLHHPPHDDHHAWIHYFEEFTVHGMNARLPWKRHHVQTYPVVAVESTSATSSCVLYSEAASTIGHTAAVRAASKFASAQLMAMHDVLASAKKESMSAGEKFALFKRSLASHGGSFNDFLKNLTVGAVGSFGVEIFHSLLEYVDACWLELLRATRCAANTLLDATLSLFSPKATFNERVAMFLKGLSAAGIIVGSEMLEKTISAKLGPLVPVLGRGQKEFVIHVVVAIGVLLAVWIASKLLDELLHVKPAQARAHLSEACSKITGRELNEHRARVFRMSEAERERARSEA